MKFEGLTVVVIGGTSGIGFEVARLASSRGASLVVTGRDRAKLDAARRRLGAPRTVVLDAHDEQALEEFVDQIDEVDHLVSMVGDSMSGGFLTTPPDTMRHVLMSKFWANWMIGRLCSAKIRAHGTITFTAGTGGRPHEISASYVANLGLGALVQGLAVELAPRVRVNAVAPTFMSTPFWKALTQHQFEAAEREFTRGVPLGRLGTVQEVASSYIHLMENAFITGQVLAVDGGVMFTK